MKTNDRLLKRILSSNTETSSKALDEADDFDPIPSHWAKPLVAGYLDRTKSGANRERILRLFNRLPESLIIEALRESFEIDAEYFSDVAFYGDMRQLNNEVENLAPAYHDSSVVKGFIERYIEQNLSGAQESQAFFEWVAPGAQEWIDNPQAIPCEYNIPGKCATCSSWVPSTISEGGVLGECAVHSAELGLFRQDASCGQWARKRLRGSS